MKISAVLITFNEEENLPRCLRSLVDIADEFVVVDSGSEDRTVAMAESIGAKVIFHEWQGYVDQKNFAIEQASHDWILSIDADEELSDELRHTLLRLKEYGEEREVDGYLVSRVVFYHGRWIRHGDWYPDYLVRFFRKKKGRFEGGKVHERMMVEGMVKTLPGELFHYTYRDSSDRRDRLKRYAQLWAESKYDAGVRTNMFSAWTHATWAFFKGFIFRGGFLDGIIGCEIAWGNAWGVYIKYRILCQIALSKK